MRKAYEKALTIFFREKLIKCRDRLDMTQAEIAFHLELDSRNYCKLEYGESCCGGVTLALFLIHYCDDLQEFLDEHWRVFENEYNKVLQNI